MKPRLTLSAKILLIAFLNLALLGGVGMGVFRAQLPGEASSLLLAPVRDHIVAAARECALDLEETPVSGRDALLERYSNHYEVRFLLWDNDGNQVAGPKTTLPENVMRALLRRPPPRFRRPERPPIPREEVEEKGLPRGTLPPPGFFFEISRSPLLYWVGVRIPIRSQGSEEVVRGLLVLSSPTLFANAFFFNPWPLLLLGAGAAGISALCWVPFLRGITQSIARMSAATEQIAAGQFNVHLEERRRDELGNLSDSINRMAGQLATLVHGQKRFLGDVAHELCAPIARIQFAAGILEQRAGDSSREYVADLQEEVEHMSGLVNELLHFTRAGLQQKPLSLAQVKIAETVRRAVDREAAGRDGIEIEVNDGLTAQAAPEFLFRAISNLVRNAIRYAGDAGPIRISAARSGDEVIVTVADHGPGLAESQLEQVFQPFYRPEAARRRETGGAGLGLAIVKSCVEACAGRVSCRNRKPSGLEVEIRLRA